MKTEIELKINHQNEISEEYQMKKDIFLKENGWSKRECKICQKTYFSKRQTAHCGKISCGGELEFLKDERKGKIIPLVDLNSTFQSFFKKTDFVIYPAKSILNQNGTTLFTSAGVQILDDLIFRGKLDQEKPIVISQPSLRTQYIDKISEGNSLSFVNICTEIVNASPETHIQTLNKWMKYLSSIGIYMGDITIHEREIEQKWGDINLKSKIIAIFYKGLEIGDGNYDYNFNPSVKGLKTVSDFGFGLERLSWILRKDSYFDSIGPLKESLKKNFNNQEIIKTLTLMASSGLEPSNKDKGYRYRSFTKRLAELNFPKYLELKELIEHYYNYWNYFVDSPKDLKKTYENIHKEYDRSYNQIINHLTQTCADPNCSTEEFLLNLLKGGIKRENLAKLLEEK